jgi:hypothetical protein
MEKQNDHRPGGERMSDLIKALQIFLKYGDPSYPTNCSHDMLAIMEIDKNDVSVEDIAELDKLGFFWSDSGECFISLHFGSG